MKKISIIIVTYNSLGLINDCLRSIFDNNDIGDNLDVIVADNASADQKELFELIGKEFSGYNIRYFDTGENAGYGKGNNYGIRHTDSDVVIVMNPDVRFLTPVFSKIMKEFENPNLGMAGVNFIDGSLPYYFKPEHISFIHDFFIHSYVRRRRYDDKRMYMSGSLLIFDRQAFIDAGMYDENIFMYYEEPDITNRIQALGKEVRWLKDTMVQHLAHGRKYNQKLIDIGYDSYEYYCKKYGLDAKKGYKKRMRILRLKIIAAQIVGAKDDLDVFCNTLKSMETHIKKL